MEVIALCVSLKMFKNEDFLIVERGHVNDISVRTVVPGVQAPLLNLKVVIFFMQTSRKEYQAKWYQENKEHCKQKTYKWRETHPGYNKEYYQKSKDKFQKYYLANKDKIRIRSKIIRDNLKRNSPEIIMFRAAKARAKKRGLKFNIGISDIIIPERCPVLGIKLEFAIGRNHQEDFSPTLDRFDNNLGYIKGNVQVISSKANRIKTDATAEEVRKVADWMDSLVN